MAPQPGIGQSRHPTPRTASGSTTCRSGSNLFDELGELRELAPHYVVDVDEVLAGGLLSHRVGAPEDSRWP
jgi:hypothetical protein